ncbi:hypothetical protein [Klebsiella pneumoniae]|uniref:hypothetical protein n=1 Tax=Klebsiella pneumoniae TaxID=573 RepID=UPI00187B123D|nr:hypothetical protein [Klebsiella pneumoniae]
MADVASLAVGLHLNAASFKSQLLGAYGDAENQSRRFNRNAGGREKTEDAYKKVGLSISGMASRLAGLAGAGFPSVRSSPRPDNMDRRYQICRPSPVRLQLK